MIVKIIRVVSSKRSLIVVKVKLSEIVLKYVIVSSFHTAKFQTMAMENKSRLLDMLKHTYIHQSRHAFKEKFKDCLNSYCYS